jgi:hypothetical protein
MHPAKNAREVRFTVSPEHGFSIGNLLHVTLLAPKISKSVDPCISGRKISRKLKTTAFH